MSVKFESGDRVSYHPQCAPGIKMEDTEVIGFFDEHENVWAEEWCEKSGDYRPKRQESGEIERRYIIEHMYGWNPSAQPTVSHLHLDASTRYYFAYESELSHL